MSFVSIEFIVFVVVSLLFYYGMPKSKRWIVLLFVSYAFYFLGGRKDNCLFAFFNSHHLSCRMWLGQNTGDF